MLNKLQNVCIENSREFVAITDFKSFYYADYCT